MDCSFQKGRMFATLSGEPECFTLTYRDKFYKPKPQEFHHRPTLFFTITGEDNDWIEELDDILKLVREEIYQQEFNYD